MGNKKMNNLPTNITLEYLSLKSHGKCHWRFDDGITRTRTEQSGLNVCKNHGKYHWRYDDGISKTRSKQSGLNVCKKIMGNVTGDSMTEYPKHGVNNSALMCVKMTENVTGDSTTEYPEHGVNKVALMCVKMAENVAGD
jgi:hypothetical protein